jgi:inward rectifier potassium channel
VTNLLFALAYVACGPGALEGAPVGAAGDRFAHAFFFSVQTLATIGYGRISPSGFAANALVALEAIVGLMGFSLATGLAFARFSQPQAKILFSDHAVIAPYRGVTGFMFRIANERDKQLVNLKADVVLTRRERVNGEWTRKFHALPLERSSVLLFPLHWVVVHPIDETSPLYGATAEDLVTMEAEFLILLTGYDETSFQEVHARSSYKGEEILVGMRFSDMFVPGGPMVSVDLRKIHDVEPAVLPAPQEPKALGPTT